MNFKKSLSNAICSSALSKGRGVCLAVCCLLLVGAWSCSSDDDSDDSGLTKSTFATAQKPQWYVDWTADDPVPDWQEPTSYSYECSMSLLVTLDPLLLPFSTDDDQLAVFIDGSCRGVSKRNVYPDGSIVFLIHAKGASEEVGKEMKLHYYSGGARELFVSWSVPPFEPNNNITEEGFALFIDPTISSTKYPYYTDMSVSLPETLPFIVSDDDQLAVFVGDECRGVFTHNEDYFVGWKGSVQQREKGEQAYVRYYSATMGGVYTFNDTFTLNEQLLQVNIAF